VGDLREMAQRSDERPIVMCEYSHAMGNSNGGAADYDDAVTADGRIELLHYLREQSISRTRHRYGNLV